MIPTTVYSYPSQYLITQIVLIDVLIFAKISLENGIMLSSDFFISTA